MRRFAFGQTSEYGGQRSEEQLGKTEAERPDACLIWVLSETASEAGPAPVLSQALSERLDRPVKCLVTPVDEAPLAPSVERQVIHQLAPADSEGSVGRFLDHWTPDIGVVIGRPSRPRLLTEAAARDIPLFCTSSHRDMTSQRRYPAYFKLFSKCLTASASETNSLRTQFHDLKDQLETTGPMSDTVFALSCNEAECDEIAKMLGGRPVWLAAEAAGIEIDIVEAAHRKAFRSAHRLLLILVPGDGEDPAEIVSRLETRGWRVARRSEQEEPDADIQIYVADTEDELGLWYRLAPASFVGGSLRPEGEPTDSYAPAALGSAVLHGPNKGKNPSRIDTLESNGACVRVANADELGEAVITLLAPDKAASLAQAGWAVTTESAHVVERLAEVIEEVIYEREDAD